MALTIADLAREIAKNRAAAEQFVNVYFATPEQRTWMRANRKPQVKAFATLVNTTSDMVVALQKYMQDPVLAAQFEAGLDRNQLVPYGIRKCDGGRWVSLAVLRESGARISYLLANDTLKGYDSSARLAQLYKQVLADYSKGKCSGESALGRVPMGALGELDDLGAIITTTVVIVAIICAAVAATAWAVSHTINKSQELDVAKAAEARKVVEATETTQQQLITSQDAKVQEILTMIREGKMSEDVGIVALEKLVDQGTAVMLAKTAAQEGLVKNLYDKGGSGWLGYLLTFAGVAAVGFVGFLGWKKVVKPWLDARKAGGAALPEPALSGLELQISSKARRVYFRTWSCTGTDVGKFCTKHRGGATAFAFDWDSPLSAVARYIERGTGLKVIHTERNGFSHDPGTGHQVQNYRLTLGKQGGRGTRLGGHSRGTLTVGIHVA